MCPQTAMMILQSLMDKILLRGSNENRLFLLLKDLQKKYPKLNFLKSQNHSLLLPNLAVI
jgi:hypothetical protein